MQFVVSEADDWGNLMSLFDCFAILQTSTLKRLKSVFNSVKKWRQAIVAPVSQDSRTSRVIITSVEI